MPHNRRSRAGKNRRHPRLDRVVYPIFWSSQSGSATQSTAQTISSTFDRTRAFRVGLIQGEVSATDYPTLCQIEVFGPETSSDNVWACKPFLIPTGIARRFRYHIPALVTLWFPAEVALSYPLFRANFICVDKSRVSKVTGCVSVTVLLRPVEVDYSCPKLMVQPNVTSEHSESETTDVGFETVF